jgi:hypothetical protein
VTDDSTTVDNEAVIDDETVKSSELVADETEETEGTAGRDDPH